MAGATRPAAAPSGQQSLGVAGWRRRQDARGLGHLARRALLRHPDSRYARKIFLRLARRANRLPRFAQELLRFGKSQSEGRIPQLREVPRCRRYRDDPLHRQGHHLFPHPVLAGDAQLFGLQDARPGERARIHHRVGGQDVEIARHRNRSAALSRFGDESGVAAVLHRGEAQRERRGHRFRSR